jgi:hypothetical protein
MSARFAFFPGRRVILILLVLLFTGILLFMDKPFCNPQRNIVTAPRMGEPDTPDREPAPNDPFAPAPSPAVDEHQYASAIPLDPVANLKPAAVSESFTVSVRVAGGQGMVSPVHQVVTAKGRAEVTITPSPGYRIESLQDNGQAKSALSPYLIYPVTKHHDLTVTFINDAPQVTIIEPGEGLPVLGRVTVRALIVDDGDLAGAELVVNGVTVQRVRKPAPQITEEVRIPGFIQTEDFSFAASPGGLQLSEEGELRQFLKDGRPVPLLCPDYELRDLQVLPERGWMLLSFGRDLSDSFGQRSPLLLLDPARSRASGLISPGFEILPSQQPGREAVELHEDGSLSFSVRDTLTGDLFLTHWSAAEGRRFRAYTSTDLPLPLPRSQIAWLEFSTEEEPLAEIDGNRVWTFIFDSQAEPPGPLHLAVRAWDQADASGEAGVTVTMTPIDLGLSGERRTVTHGPLNRQLGALNISVSAPQAAFSKLRLLRRTGDGAFVPQITFTPNQLNSGFQEYADRYLDADRIYRYRLEALDETGRVLGRSEELEL